MMKTNRWNQWARVLLVLGVAACMWLLPHEASATPASQEGPPPNDNFADAIEFTGIPFESPVNLSLATVEPDEVVSACLQTNYQTAWYKFTPSVEGYVTLTMYADFGGYMVLYEGTAATDLREINCTYSYGQITFRAEAGKSYYIQVLDQYNLGGMLTLRAQAPPPLEWYYVSVEPLLASTYSPIQATAWVFDSTGLGVGELAWDFGDGTSTTGPNSGYVYHTYDREGTYVVTVTASRVDGATATRTQSVRVENHDVAITKFSVPQSGRAGQTRAVSVGVSSRLREERVIVTLYKSADNGGRFDLVGFLTQTVPVRGANRTTPFDFSYTFTAADAQQGTVTFKAEAQIQNYNDVLPADNTAISLPTKVSGGQAGAAAAVDAGRLFLPVVTGE